MLNWLKGFLCKEAAHIPIKRHQGINVIGYECESCGHQWYEKRDYSSQPPITDGKPDYEELEFAHIKLIEENEGLINLTSKYQESACQRGARMQIMYKYMLDNKLSGMEEINGWFNSDGTPNKGI